MKTKTPSTTPLRSVGEREPAEGIVRKGLPRADPAPALGLSQRDRNLFDAWYHQLAIEPRPNTLEDDADDEWLLARMQQLRSATPEELLELRAKRLRQLARGEGSWSDLTLATVDHGPPATWSPDVDIAKRILNVVDALDCELAIEDSDDWRPNTPEEDRLDEWLEARGQMIRMTSPTAD